MNLKRNSLIFLFIMVYTLLMTITSMAYVAGEFNRVGGPYSIDSNGCAPKYITVGNEDIPLRECLDEKGIRRAELIAVTGILVSVAMAVALYRTEKIRRKQKIGDLSR